MLQNYYIFSGRLRNNAPRCPEPCVPGILESLDLDRKINYSLLIVSVPILITHRTQGIANHGTVGGCDLATGVCSERHPTGGRSTGNDGRTRKCVLSSHAMDDQQRCNNLRVADIRL